MTQKVMAVNPDTSRLKSITDFDGDIQVPCMDTSGETVKGVMGLLKDVFYVFEFCDGDDGTKDFFLHYFHFFVDVCEDGGLDEVAWELGPWRKEVGWWFEGQCSVFLV